MTPDEAEQTNRMHENLRVRDTFNGLPRDDPPRVADWLLMFVGHRAPREVMAEWHRAAQARSRKLTRRLVEGYSDGR